MNALMKLCLTDPELVKSKQLTKTQIELYEFIKTQKHGVLSTVVARHNNTNRNVAHERLKTLYEKGYLKRTRSLAMTNGVEYRYEAIPMPDLLPLELLEQQLINNFKANNFLFEPVEQLIKDTIKTFDENEKT